MGNYQQIREQFRGDNEEPWSVLHRGHQIVALCLRKDVNPRVDFNSVEVWVEDAPVLAEWGERLAAEKMAIPVYVAEREGEDYACLGFYYVQPRQHTPAELAAAENQVPHALSRIIFLDRAYVTDFIYR
jgi:hypothetical protein